MTFLDDILRTLRITGSVYFCDVLVAPWRRTFGDADRASFHLIRQGSCRLEAGGHAGILDAGDLVYAKAGVVHTLGSDRSQSRADLDTYMLCGYCKFEAPIDHPLIDSLPTITLLRAAEIAERPWLSAALEQLSLAYMPDATSLEVVVDKLTEVMVIELVNAAIRQSSPNGFIRALHDRQVSRTLHLLHSQPERPWTIEELGLRVAMSRSALAKRFKDTVGQPIFEYLTRVRMLHAQTLLRAPDASVGRVAGMVGYGSDLAFSKAFKRQTGMTPSQFRSR